jgi:hypothetical protein
MQDEGGKGGAVGEKKCQRYIYTASRAVVVLYRRSHVITLTRCGSVRTLPVWGRPPNRRGKQRIRDYF